MMPVSRGGSQHSTQNAGAEMTGRIPQAHRRKHQYATIGGLGPDEQSRRETVRQAHLRAKSKDACGPLRTDTLPASGPVRTGTDTAGSKQGNPVADDGAVFIARRPSPPFDDRDTIVYPIVTLEVTS
jgi:hypothetical protein